MKHWEDDIAAALLSVRYHVTSETELHEAIARVLTDAGVPFQREVRLTKADRIDFLCQDVGLEVKVDGTQGQIAAQLQRYAACPEVRALMLVTTRLRYSAFDGLTLAGKRVRVLRIQGGFL